MAVESKAQLYNMSMRVLTESVNSVEDMQDLISVIGSVMSEIAEEYSDKPFMFKINKMGEDGSKTVTYAQFRLLSAEEHAEENKKWGTSAESTHYAQTDTVL